MLLMLMVIVVLALELELLEPMISVSGLGGEDDGKMDGLGDGEADVIACGPCDNCKWPGNDREKDDGSTEPDPAAELANSSVDERLNTDADGEAMPTARPKPMAEEPAVPGRTGGGGANATP